ncbi:MAG: group 1 truncated hemoglobin, partial [Alphaproteobacteria bacterium]
KMHVVNLVCAGAGGPCNYTGRSMKDSHAGLKITSREFDFVVEDLVAALDKFNVPEKEKSELLSLLGPMRKEIVEVP